MKSNTFFPKKNGAQAMVEFAIVLPILLMLLYGILEAGRLLFIYSSIVTASRQAVRYGAAVGVGTTPNIPRYRDCRGIRQAAQRVDFLNAFNDENILIYWDTGPSSTQTQICTNPNTPVEGNNYITAPNENSTRLIVKIEGSFYPIVPKLVSFIERSTTNSPPNPIVGSSARTILTGVTIVVTPPGGGASSLLSLDSVSASRSTYSSAGEEIIYTYTVTNNGTVELTGVTINDSLLGPISCAATLAPGASVTCTATYITTTADTADIVTEAYASGSDGTNPITSNTITTTITFQAAPALELEKSPSPTASSIVGTVITYTYTLTNTGNVTLNAPYTVTDDKVSVSCPSTTDLGLGTQTTCTATYTLKQSDINQKTVVNQAQAFAMYGSTQVSSNQVTATVYTPALYLTASVSPSSVSQVGQVITYTYTFTNNSNSDLTSPYSLSGGRGTDNCGNNTGTLTPGSSFACTGTYTVTQADLDAGTALVNNNIVASAKPAQGNQTQTSNTVSVSVSVTTNPALSVQAAASPTAPTPPATGMPLNQVINYTYTLTNSGNVTLSSPAITDTKVTNVTCSGSIAPGASITCTGTYNVTQADIDAGSFTSQATASATSNSQTVSAGASPITVVTYQGPRLSLQITPNPTSYNGVGQFIVYTYTLTNSGSGPLNGPYLVSDNKVSSVDCSTATSPLAVGASTTCVGSYQTTQADVNNGNIVNSASATASDGTQTITSNSAMAVVYVPGAPTITPSASPVCTATTVTLTANADSWIDENSVNTNNGSGTTLNVQSRNNNRNQRTLVTFSLPSMPAGCKIQSATLRLNASASASGRTLQALQILGNWTENGVNWNNQPGTTGTAATTASGSGWREWNVTSIVQAMMSGTNNGFLIRDAVESDGGSAQQQEFISRENASADKPQLVITYTQAP
jgi:hypothetical protein